MQHKTRDMKHRFKFQVSSFIALVLLFAIFSSSLATDFSSPSFTVKDPVIDTGLSRGTSTNFGLGQSLTQTAIGRSSSTNFRVWSGFQYYYQVNANTLTATAGNGQVSLSWTVPQTFLGAVVGNYDVGTGTVSGSYTFESAGNVTSFTKTGLTNGTTYYFRVRAETAAGTFLVFSNEASAVPVGEAPRTIGGGAGPPLPANLTVKGLAPPNSQVTILRDGQFAAAVRADGEGRFEKTLTGLTPGVYNFGLYAVDGQGAKTSTFNFSQNLSSQVTNVIDILLAPTIRSSHTVIKQGEDLVVSGYTVSNSLVTLLLNNQPFTTTSRPDGFWTIIISTPNLNLGKYQLTIRVTKNGQTSQTSTVLEFEVSKEKSVPTTEEKLPPGICGRSDLNCDGRVDLVDFSILLYYWQQVVSINVRADINQSGLVDLGDFSVMMFDWTG